jgi:hypothetical protein
VHWALNPETLRSIQKIVKIEIQLSEVEVALVAAAVVLVAFVFNRKKKNLPIPKTNGGGNPKSGGTPPRRQNPKPGRRGAGRSYNGGSGSMRIG